MKKLLELMRKRRRRSLVKTGLGIDEMLEKLVQVIHQHQRVIPMNDSAA